METVRLDKWLWAARFFKTRSDAAQACDLGRVSLNTRESKPAKDVKPGDMLNIRNEGGDFEVEVLGISSARGPAAVAQGLYRETDASKTARAAAAEQRKLMAAMDMPSGRPTKKDRRDINKARGRIVRF